MIPHYVHNRFKIAGGSRGLKISWQVTSIRRDAWAKANRVIVEDNKPKADRGRYLHPEAHGEPRERGVGRAHYLEAQKHLGRE